MQRLAVLWVDSEEVRMFASPWDAAWPAVNGVDANVLDGAFVFPSDVLPTVCDNLDRAGFIWAADRRFTPRTWADWLFAEVDHRALPVVVEELHRVLWNVDRQAWSVLRFTAQMYGMALPDPT